MSAVPATLPMFCVQTEGRNGCELSCYKVDPDPKLFRLARRSPGGLVYREPCSSPSLGPRSHSTSRDRFSNGSRPPYSSVAHFSSTSKSLYYQWERMYLHNGLIYRQWESPDGIAVRGQRLVPSSLRGQFMELVHSGMTGGHLGRSKTEDQTAHRAHWPSWSRDVRLFLKRCTNCARFHRGKPPRQTKLKPFLSGEPFELTSIDITCPHPTSRRGNQYILTVVDHYSKWAEAFPNCNHHADTVANQLATHVFPRFGIPRRLLSDRGPEFESDLFREVCRLLTIDKLRTTSFKASTNGIVERFHSTLNSCIAKVVDEKQRDWDECLPLVLAAYRSSAMKAPSTPLTFCCSGEKIEPQRI
jgi:transposase InsO family protein